MQSFIIETLILIPLVSVEAPKKTSLVIVAIPLDLSSALSFQYFNASGTDPKRELWRLQPWHRIANANRVIND